MKLRVIGSTQPGFTLPVDEALLFSGREAGICYMPDDFDALLAEPESRTLARVQGTVGSGHHSVAGHVSYNLILEGLPKIVAMLLNNEHDYNTSEKSARYTKMGVDPDDESTWEILAEVPEPVGVERDIYEKWIDKFARLSLAEYPHLEAKTLDKLAKENARYFISVFTPATTMGYTSNLRQLNYIVGFCDSFLTESSSNPFLIRLRPWVRALRDALYGVVNVDGLRDNKGRQFSLFSHRSHFEEFGENYSTNYFGTFAQLAQAQRHRTLWYEMIPYLDSCTFFVPPIIQDEATRQEYLADMETLKENFPQGMLVDINERGTPEAFLLKCEERLCGAAQLEICHQTARTLAKYMEGCVLKGNPFVYKMLAAYNGKTKCQFGHYTCNRPCPLGPQNVYTRKI